MDAEKFEVKAYPEMWEGLGMDVPALRRPG